MHVIGTAGHVDHGKSTLIEALTGTHPDRLKEEQARQMTIDLGFGWVTLPNGEQIGIVDVPGHRDFIENMLAGVGGIDAVLLVIAADEGVMPQTREHLAILDLLQIPAGMIVLTKTDLVPEKEWLELVESDVRKAVRGTILADAPIVRVSARTHDGLAQLLATLSKILSHSPPRSDLGRPRLPIDRVFSMSGFGTVVTGTLTDGHLAVGDEVQILPSGLTGRIRGLQTHKKKEETAQPGSRTAVNLAGIDNERIWRGEVLTYPNLYQPTRRFDARFRMLPDASAPLRHSSEVKVFLGTAQSMANFRLLDAEELMPGQEGWVQLELNNPIVAVRGDRYILRRPSPGETLGGGVIIDPQSKNRHKRFDSDLIKSLTSLAQGSPSDVLYEVALGLRTATVGEIVKHSHLEAGVASQALEGLLAEGRLIALEKNSSAKNDEALVITAPHWSDLRAKTLHLVDGYHLQYPLRRGIPREELKNRLDLSARVFNAVMDKLASDGLVTTTGSLVAKIGHEIKFDSGQQIKVQALMRKFAQSPYSPPSLKECQAEAGEEIVNALIETGELVKISSEVLFRKQDYDSMVAKIRDALIVRQRITIADVRDLFDSSRKYMLPLMEHLDSIGLTLRDGDYRKLRK